MKNLYKFFLACLFVLVGIFPLAHTVHAVIDYHAYVANTTNSTVSVIDKVSNSVIATVPVGDTPTDVKAYPPNHRVYVANNAGQSISVIDTNTNTVVTTIPLGTGSPFGLALSNDGSRLYATGGGDNNVYVIDTATNTVIATLTGFDVPYNLTVNPTGTRLYVTNNIYDPSGFPQNGYVSVVDTSNYTVLTTIPVGPQPTGIGISPDGTKVYVANFGDANPGNTVSVIDTATNTVIHNINVPSSPSGIAFNSTGSRAYVSSANNGGVGDGTVSVINTVTDQVIASVSQGVGGNPNELAVSPDDNYIYVVPNAGNTTQIIDAATNTVTGSITVGLHPWGIAFGEEFTVNQPPHVNPLSGGTINEGGTYSENGSFTDPDSTSWTGRVDYGDGSGEHDFASPNETIDQTNHTFTISHVYKDNQANNAPYTVTVKITDNQGSTSDPATAQVTVNNVAPTPGAITVSNPVVQVNNSITASANFTDPGVLDTHNNSGTYWNWGDGHTTTGTVTESNGSGSVSDSHTYSTAGVYTVTLTVQDNAGASGTSAYQYVSVYNPTSQGLFSAGQHFSSPAGAYPQNTSLTGTVKFGLSYKYQGTMPVGDKQFTMNFNAANLLFNATTISSLVIANNVATLTGTGTLNGSGTYNFLVVGVNGGGIRVQITDPSNNNAVKYDTQPGDPATATPTTSVTGNVIAHN